MRQPPAPRRVLRSGVALAAVLASGTLGSFCGTEQVFWVCHNPVTGKDDGTIFDENHFVNGVADPCHCFDPCGPEKTCPIEVDAGPFPPGCDAGDGADGGP